MPNIPLKEIILYYYLKKDLIHDPPVPINSRAPHLGSLCPVSPPLAAKEIDDFSSDEEERIFKERANINSTCSNCRIRDPSKFQRIIPKGAPIHCDDCRLYWLKYDSNKPVGEQLKKGNKEESNYDMLQEDSSESSATLNCTICKDSSEYHEVEIISCVSCNLQVHSCITLLI